MTILSLTNFTTFPQIYEKQFCKTCHCSWNLNNHDAKTKVNAFARAATPLTFIITEFMNTVRVTDGEQNPPTAA